MSENDCDKYDELLFGRYLEYSTSCDGKIEENEDIKEIEGFDDKYLGYYNSQPESVGLNGCLGPETVGQPCHMISTFYSSIYITKKVVL